MLVRIAHGTRPCGYRQGEVQAQFPTDEQVQECVTAIIQIFTDDLREDEDTMLCFAYDYAYMLLAHAAAVLMNMSKRNVTPTATSSCAQAITAMVGSDRSAIRFPTDLANNLRLIAKEMGMELNEWVGADVIAKMDSRSCE